MRTARLALAAAGALLVAAGCATPTAIQPSSAARPAGFILAAGRRVPVDVPVVTFVDPGGFDARVEHRWFSPDVTLPSAPAAGCDTPRRWSERRGGPPVRDLDDLRERVTQVILHYDAAVTSTRCFEVLHDVRGLSAHFLLDVDGTVFQTLDLATRARHAGASNDASIGIEIAHPGAWTERAAADRFHRDDGARLAIPASLAPPRGAPLAPSRPGWFTAQINGSEVHQRDFTGAQYDALGRLLDSLRRTFPALREGPPREADGTVRRDVLGEADRAAARGVLGHQHVSASKVDPGPAFDWRRVAGAAR